MKDVLFENKVRAGTCLPIAEELKLFELDNAEEMVKLYITKHPLCDEAELKLFELENAEEILKLYIKKYPLSWDAQLKLFELDNADEMLKLYIVKYPLCFCDEALVKYFKLGGN